MSTQASVSEIQLSTPGAAPSSPDAQPSPESSPTTLPHASGETPRAFNAFVTFLQLGHTRSLQAVADQLGENIATIKNWSSRHSWNARVNAHAAGLLEQQVHARAAVARDQLADWARRNAELREEQWLASRKLLSAAQCFLDSFGDQELQRMNLSQVSRALQIGSRLGHQALSASPMPDEPAALAPVQAELMTALKKMYGPATDVSDPASPSLPLGVEEREEERSASGSPTSPSPTPPTLHHQLPNPQLTSSLPPRIVGGSLSVIGGPQRSPTP